ncbi:exodeoxyribonuclease V subunit beta [Prevotella sp. S7 MS 2]|uniref:UvrD-helicase domain-containing protein n=1 Tax=Prevotella sp. S7 MS 2 TaxID=1287488 RepID=UPI0005134888|nr:UvrD-helicase domain-containing protein [Prevotella sp. S7 MS 2]KGI59813.1 ATP-dependent DNA helicase UvrD [Prevotella sp. S7 MS 2]
MTQHQNNTLTVYRASAGSGKTFTLTIEYIKLLIDENVNYKSILAVTFTNKATEEMKLRILGQLYGIWKNQLASKPYLDKIAAETKLPIKIIMNRCGQALHNLLHNYNYFKVETIDAFFQTILRNLARELELSAILNVGLNDIQIEHQATDELIDQLEKGNKIIYWILDYIQENMDDGKSWNVIGKIKSFGESIFKEYYKQHSEKLRATIGDDKFFYQYTKEIKKIQQEAKDKMAAQAQIFFDIVEKHGFNINDFSKGDRGACGYFLKLKSGEFWEDEKIYNKSAQNASENPDAWVTKKFCKDGEPIYELAKTQLSPLLHTTESIRVVEARNYKSATLTLRHMYQLRLLNSIENKVHEINQLSNRFLLSDTQTLLSQMIQGNDAPFIYEKIGSQLEHIMIDEFQDTSTVQWQNFKTLLLECMSHGYSPNLIVGDVKQSIYRWRSGDWRLLNNITQQFEDTETVACHSLSTNYRSNRNIIEFNNRFFTQVVEAEYDKLTELKSKEAEELKRAYSDVVQEIPAEKEPKGLIKIELLNSNDLYQEAMLQSVADTIHTLLVNGAQIHDIAILVRDNKGIQTISEYFTATWPDIPIVSDEAFRLDSSIAVNILINAMKVIARPDDLIARAFLSKAYNTYIKNVTSNVVIEKSEHINDILPKQFSEHIEELQHMPIRDMVEKIYSIFHIETIQSQNTYICAFYDILERYMQDNIPDIGSFLEEWDDNLHQNTIQTTETDGIRLITIHKSKGLEFDHVIIPFCDWKLDRTDRQIWCSPKEYPYNLLPIVPVDYSSKWMVGSIYEEDYYHEYLQNVVDNINLLYVAFTRAKRNLFVYGKQDDKESGRSKVIQDFIEGYSFEEGELDIESTEKSHKQDEANVFTPNYLKMDLQIQNRPTINLTFRQSNSSNDFINNMDKEISLTERTNYILHGNILHKIFSSINTSKDIPQILSKLEMEGIFDDNDSSFTYDRISNLINKRFEHPIIKEWFSGNWQLFNECNILRYNQLSNIVEVRRPDRVMVNDRQVIVIDFKFGIYHPEYEQQVREYITILTDMGYTYVKGYLWFVYSNQIKEVK